MKRYRITIETENLVSTGIILAKNADRAWHLLKMALYDQNPEHIEEISNADPIIRELSEDVESVVHKIITRI